MFGRRHREYIAQLEAINANLREIRRVGELINNADRKGARSVRNVQSIQAGLPRRSA